MLEVAKSSMVHLLFHGELDLSMDKGRLLLPALIGLVFGFLSVAFTGCAVLSKEEVAPTPLPSSSYTEVQRQPTASPSPTPSSTLTPLTKEAVAACPVTLPNEATVPDELAYYGNYGNSDLVVTLGRGGKFVVSPNYVAEDGSIGWKFGVYRRTPGKITAAGQRLDAPAPPAQGQYDIEGYGDSGFQSGGIDFPSEGCWEITIQVGEATPLTIVILMARVAFDPHSQLRISWLPEGMQRVDTDISNLPQSIGNIYGFSNGDEGTIIVEITQGNKENPEAFPKGAQQPVTVFGLSGTCMPGAWDEQGQWQSDADAGTLAWSGEGFSYRISHTKLELSCEDLLRIAGSEP